MVHKFQKSFNSKSFILKINEIYNENKINVFSYLYVKINLKKNKNSYPINIESINFFI